MWFAEFKNKVLEFKDKAVDTASQKIAETSLVLDTQKKVTDFISKTIHKNITLKSWEILNFSKKVIIICIDFKSDLYKSFILTQAPALTKWFAQNTPVRIIDKNNWNISLTNLWWEDEIFMMIFDDNKEIAKILWEQEIKNILSELYSSNTKYNNSSDEKDNSQEESNTDSSSSDGWGD